VNFALDDDHELIRDAVRGVCRNFDDTYWRRCDAEHRFPWDFYEAMAEGGWVGIAIPEEFEGGDEASPRHRSYWRRSRHRGPP